MSDIYKSLQNVGQQHMQRNREHDMQQAQDKQRAMEQYEKLRHDSYSTQSSSPPPPSPSSVEIAPLKKSLKKTYENGYNFTAVEMDWVVRGLFALHKQQPPEAEAIQQLINKLANTVYQVEPLTDEEIIETCDTWVISDIGSDEVIKIVRRTERAHGIGEKE